MRHARGFTLVEILIALVLLGIVGTAIYQLLVSNQRLYRSQVQRVTANETVRATVSILPGEIRELNAAGGDIVSMDDDDFTYRSMQALYLTCAPPDLATPAIIVRTDVHFGLKDIAAGDGVLIYAEGDTSTRTDDGWLVATAGSPTAGPTCPQSGGGGASLSVPLNVDAAALAGVIAGAPVRTFREMRIYLYQDAGTPARMWLGAVPAGANTTQPIVGPFADSGLVLTYFDSTGTETNDEDEVYRIGISVVSESPQRVVRSGGVGSTYLLQDLVTQIALRNNPLY